MATLEEQMSLFQEALRLKIWFEKGGEMPIMMFCGTDVKSISFWRIFMKNSTLLQRVCMYLSERKFQKILQTTLNEEACICFQDFFDMLAGYVAHYVKDRDGIVLVGSAIADMKSWRVMQRGVFLETLDTVMEKDTFEMIMETCLKEHDNPNPLLIPPEAFEDM